MGIGSLTIGIVVGALAVGLIWLIFNRRDAASPDPSTAASDDENRYLEAIDNLDEGFILWDSEERLITCNPHYCELFADLAHLLKPGLTFESFTRAHADINPILNSDEERETWIAERLADHRNKAPTFKERQDERLGWHRARKFALKDGSVLALHSNISSQRDAEVALSESEVRFRRSFEDAPIGMSLNSIDGIILLANPALCEFLGYQADELVGMSLFDVTHPDDHQGTRDMRKKADETKSGGHLQQKRYLRKNGEIAWGAVTRAPVHDKAGKLLYFIGQVRDITTERQAEELLRLNEERFRDFAASTADRFWEADSEGRFTWVSQQSENSTLIPPDMVLGRTIHEVQNLEPDREFLRQVDAAWQAREPYRNLLQRVRRPDGQILYLRISGKPVFDEAGTFMGYRGAAINDTARQEAEERLHESEERFRDFTASAADRYWEKDAAGRFTYVSSSPPGSDLRSPDQMLGQTERDVAGDLVDEAYFARLEEAMAAQAPYRDLVRRAQGANGLSIFVRTAARPVFGEDGTFAGYRGTAVDDTARHSAEERAQTTEAQFFSAMERVPVGIAYWGSDDRLIMCNSHFWEVNPEFVRYLKPGITYRQFLDDLVKDLHPDLAGADLDRWRLERLADFHSDTTDQEVERNGRWHRVRRYRFPGGGSLGFHTDITEMREREEALRHAQKMEAVGQLTGGVAHDFNNLLAAILGNLEIIGDRVKNDEALKSRVDRAIRSTQRGGELTNRLLAFSRRQNLDPHPVDLNELIDGMADLLNRTLGEVVRVETTLERTTGSAMVDANQLENAILNLAINSRDAMPGSGLLKISSANVRLSDNSVISNETVVEGDYVAVQVTDEGEGISAEVMEHIFEPFFTTKDIGQGSGLGLSMVYGFVRQSGGYVDVESEVGHGSTVTLYLPLWQGESEASTSPAVSIDIPRGRGERIFLVEDDVEVREVTTMLLADLGYQVIDGGDGLAALDALKQDPEVDLLLTDVVLPNGQSGPELARRARQEDQELRVLYMTGYAENSQDHQGWLGLAPALITKPFERSELATKIRETLDQPRH